MFQLAVRSLKLVWGVGQAAGDGAGREGGGGLVLHRRTTSTRSLGQWLPCFYALPVLQTLKICSSVQSTGLLLPMSPSSDVVRAFWLLRMESKVAISLWGRA